MLGGFHDMAVKDFLKLAQIRPEHPRVEFLGRLARAFMRFPYENLTKIIRAHEIADPIERLRLPATIFGEHVEFGAGGTCFSLTYYFRNILAQCGYVCDTVLCDRSYGPDTHCALIARIDGVRYLVDPGYLLEHPLALPDRGIARCTSPTGEVMLTRLGATSQYLLSTVSGGKTSLRYRLKDVPVCDEVFLAKWIDSFSWAQMRHVCITRLGDNGQIYMRDQHLRHSTAERRAQEKITTRYEAVVADTFGISAAVVERARSYLK